MAHRQQKRAPLPTRTGQSSLAGQPSTTLVERASHGWNAFLARTGPLPGEDHTPGGAFREQHGSPDGWSGAEIEEYLDLPGSPTETGR
ncbi:hypothetical protein ACH4TC_18630 [Streptomyces spororaveus]|uniref:hypothetical protein n=1 Tax=Streptomyces spororaveus TaxID=284039 RepID=UPI0037BC05B5